MTRLQFHLALSMIWTITLVLLLCACAGPGGPGKKQVNKQHGKPIIGYRAAPPDLLDGEERLDIFIGIPHDPPSDEDLANGKRTNDQWKDVIYCIALNEEEDPLPEVERLINNAPAGKEIYLWMEPINARWGFWWDGVDCRARVIAVWHVKADDYVYIALDYTMPYWKQISVKNVLKGLVKVGKEVL